MATTCTKSLSSDFGGSFRQRQFHDEVTTNVGITPILQGITVTGDTIDITFDSALSAGEQTTLNNIISAHVPDNSKPRQVFYNVSPKKESTKATSYTKVATFTYEGSNNIGTIDYIDIISYMDSNITSYDARIYDKTNNLVICEVIGLTNTDDSINNLGTISNVPVSQSILELQLRKVGGTGNDSVHIESINIYHGN